MGLIKGEFQERAFKRMKKNTPKSIAQSRDMPKLETIVKDEAINLGKKRQRQIISKEEGQ